MMDMFFLLYLAVGEIRIGVMEPKNTLVKELRYFKVTKTLNSIITMLDIMSTLGDIPRHRALSVPWGFTIGETIDHLYHCSASARANAIDVETMMMSEFCRSNGMELTITAAIRELRLALYTHIEKDNVHPALEDYLLEYYELLIKELIRASR